MCASTDVVSAGEEARFVVRVGRGGRVTMPKSVRVLLTVSKGDIVECSVRKPSLGWAHEQSWAYNIL